MVGGFAANLHGYRRLTAVLELWLQDTLPNRKKFRKSLKDLGHPDYKELETIDLIPGWSSIRLDSGFELDVMTSLSGFPAGRFDECYEIAPTAIINTIPVKFLHLNQLIEAKKKAGRPKDLLDVIELERINRENQG